MILTGCPVLRGKQRRHRLEVDRDLAAEAAADLLRHHLDLLHRDVEHGPELAAGGEGALSAGPDREVAVLAPGSGAVVRFDVSLVDGGGVDLVLRHRVGLGKTFGDVPELVLVVRRDVALPAGVLAELLRGQVLVQEHGILLHRLEDLGVRRQHLVVDVDQAEGFLGDVLVDRRHPGDGMAAVEHLVGGQDVVAHVFQLGRPLAEVDDFVPFGRGQVTQSGDHGAHPLQRLGPAGVDRPDAGVPVRGAQHLPVEHAGKLHVAPVHRAAGHLVGAVVPYRPGADDLVLLVAVVANLAVGRCHLSSSVFRKADCS